MARKDAIVIRDSDIYVLTRRGENELRGSETSLTPSEIELLVRTDGISTVGRLKAAMRSMPADVVVDAMQKLAVAGYVGIAPPSDAIAFTLDDTRPPKSRSGPSTADMARAKEEAPTGISKLRTSGYYVSIAHRPAARQQAKEGEKLTVVVVEDEAMMSKFLRQYLEIEGFEVRTAANREEIVAALRAPPLPALVLLDVMLPDADGFEVLQRMRAHPSLKSVPAVMLTARATRESVLKGLAWGANGYVTKPFEAEALVRAVKTVLGLPLGKRSQDPWAGS